jgi:hypothetical protein
MRKICVVLIAIVCSLAYAGRAQDTNALKTEIGIFESQTGVVIVKGFGQVGSVSTGAAVISVRCKESTSLATGRKDLWHLRRNRGEPVAGAGHRGL